MDDRTRIKHCNRIAQECINSAKREFGGGWRHFSDDIRYAIVVARVAGVAMGQDASVSAERIVQNMRTMCNYVYSVIHGPAGDEPCALCHTTETHPTPECRFYRTAKQVQP